MPTNWKKLLQQLSAAFAIAICCANFATSKPAKEVHKTESEKEQVINDPAFQKGLLDIAAVYKRYGKIDETAHVAPTRCAFVLSTPRLSASNDTGTHGKKVYFLFAKDANQYADKLAPKVGQVVVKESWFPAKNGGDAPTPSDKLSGLFIMAKLDPSTPNTDNGWVYGTVMADGKTVTSAGRVASCMGCHTTASNDRLFGLPK